MLFMCDDSQILSIREVKKIVRIICVIRPNSMMEDEADKILINVNVNYAKNCISFVGLLKKTNLFVLYMIDM